MSLKSLVTPLFTFLVTPLFTFLVTPVFARSLAWS